MMIQVPHDGPGGVTPWIAGGGATLRGVPEKNSIAPFVLSTDRTGKVIQHQGKRGTYVLMTDGSVRFVDQNVSDDVFKAMCTLGGPAPEDFALDKNSSTPLIPAPKKKDAPPPDTRVAKEPAKGETPEKAAKEPGGWVTFKSPDGFSVSMPVQPAAQDQELPGGLGKVKIHTAPLAEKMSIFAATSVTLPEGAKELLKTPEGLRTIAMAGAPEGLKIDKEAPVKLGTHTGTEFRGSVKDGDETQAMVMRVFVVENKLIVLMVASPGEPPAEAATFFDSLKIGG